MYAVRSKISILDFECRVKTKPFNILLFYYFSYPIRRLKCQTNFCYAKFILTWVMNIQQKLILRFTEKKQYNYAGYSYVYTYIYACPYIVCVCDENYDC